ncbi:MAG: chorismate mutase [Candidatus Marinimicrobia bacterium]|nr:chorismate mutase [Candidatus Neomarinimicrobiota bacterium]
MKCRGVRGATTIQENTREAILQETENLLSEMVRANEINQEDIGSVIFTTSTDVNAEYPAVAARRLGWYDQALLCGHEMDVPGGLEKCIRVLIHWNTTKNASEITHVYINGAEVLRPEHAISNQEE